VKVAAPAAPPADAPARKSSPSPNSEAVPAGVAAGATAPPGAVASPDAAAEVATAEAVPVEAVLMPQEAPAGETIGAAAAPPRGTPADDQEPIPVEIVGALYVNLLEERDYRAGEIVTLRVRVSRGPIESREAVADAAVTVKILGTEFRPLILTSKTDQDGVAVVHAWLPRFTSGRAAILVRATSDGYSAELRRAVRHS
jgi:hypothetical protein